MAATRTSMPKSVRNRSRSSRTLAMTGRALTARAVPKKTANRLGIPWSGVPHQPGMSQARRPPMSRGTRRPARATARAAAEARFSTPSLA